MTMWGLEFDLVLRCPLLVSASIVRQCINVTVVTRVQVAASGYVLEEFALHAPLLVRATVVGKCVDCAIPVRVENATGRGVGQIERVAFAVYVPLLVRATVVRTCVDCAIPV